MGNIDFLDFRLIYIALIYYFDNNNSSIQKQLPCPTSLITPYCAAWAFRISFTMDKPSPVPFSLRPVHGW